MRNEREMCTDDTGSGSRCTLVARRTLLFGRRAFDGRLFASCSDPKRLQYSITTFEKIHEVSKSEPNTLRIRRPITSWACPTGHPNPGIQACWEQSRKTPPVEFPVNRRLVKYTRRAVKDTHKFASNYSDLRDNQLCSDLARTLGTYHRPMMHGVQSSKPQL